MEREIRLYRDGQTTPWGFRLIGGKDLKQALHIQKVNPGTPAHGELEQGDVISEIQSRDATGMTHAQAQDAIKGAGGSILLRVKRPTHQSCSQSASKMLPGVQYSSLRESESVQSKPTIGAFMFQRLQGTLNEAVMGRLISSSHPPQANLKNEKFEYSFNPNYSTIQKTSGTWKPAPKMHHITVKSHLNQLGNNTPQVSSDYFENYRERDTNNSENNSKAKLKEAKIHHLGSVLAGMNIHNSNSFNHYDDYRNFENNSHPIKYNINKYENNKKASECNSSSHSCKDENIDTFVPNYTSNKSDMILTLERKPNLVSCIAQLAPTDQKGFLNNPTKRQIQTITQKYNNPIGLYSKESVLEAVSELDNTFRHGGQELDNDNDWFKSAIDENTKSTGYTSN